MKIQKDKLVQLRGEKFPNFETTIKGMFLQDKPDSLGFIEFQEYKKIGFNLLRESAPCYWYFRNGKVFHRSNFMKHKLQEKLEIFDSTLSEWENMKLNNYNRFWDCGNFVFEKVI